MKGRSFSNSTVINGVALFFSSVFLISSFIAARYTGEWGEVFHNWCRIMVSPCPLVTDYFEIGGLASAMLNAGACGMGCFLFMVGLKGESKANTLAGFFLVIAHCFYGLNFLNMWPCFLAPFIYLRHKKLNFKSNLHVCMFATSFAPFISELLFRYFLQSKFRFGEMNLTGEGIISAALFAVLIGYIIPAILPGAHAWHKGYNLYNGGLAFGLFGFFVYDFMYNTMGIIPRGSLRISNSIYDLFDRSYHLYSNCFFITIFLLCIAVGYCLNGRSFRGYRRLLKDTGYQSDFAEKYGMPVCLINIGCLGLPFLIYLNLIITFTQGAGFTGPTIGVILAALTFAAMGQHPRNVWPIVAGYQLLYFVTLFFCSVQGRQIGWSISTQSYINGVAFATGLCPIVGRYGRRAGIVTGFMCASMCTATGALHGGLVLYNGGFTAGITALILLPILEHYVTSVREEIQRPRRRDPGDMIAVVEEGEEDGVETPSGYDTLHSAR